MKLAKGVFGRYYQTGKRSIQVHFTFRGVRCRESMPGLDPETKNHQRYAENTLAAILRDIDKGTFSYIAYFPESKRARLFGHAVSTRTVKQIGTSWLADMKRALPHSTYRSYADPCEHFIYPVIGDKRIRDVTVEDLRRMFREADICLKTARNYSIPLRAIFDRALEDDDIERSPMDRIKIKKLIALERHKTDYEVDPFEQDEIDAILKACAKHRPDWLNYFTFALYSGARTSELYGFQWRDVDWRKRTLRVERAVVARKAKAPKTKTSRRTIQLNDLAIAALQRQRAATELVGAEIFRHWRTEDGKRILAPLRDYEVSQRALDFCCMKADVRRRPQKMTRHSYASHTLSQGANPLWIAAQLGHKDVQILFRVYARWISAGNEQQVSYGSAGAAKAGARD